MNTREFGAAIIKSLGVYFVAGAVIQFAGLIGLLLTSVPKAWGDMPAGAVTWPLRMSLLASAVVGAFCMFEGDRVARWLFPARVRLDGRVSRRDLLSIGIATAGLIFTVDGAPKLIAFVARVLWYAGAPRQGFLPGILRTDSLSLAEPLVMLAVGAVLLLGAQRIASRLDAHYSRAEGG